MAGGDVVEGRADEATEALSVDYDDAPYESYAHPRSAPGHLAAVAALFGLDAPDVSSAHLLEIGCAGAGNLIPFAATFPHALTVGIDISGVQIEQDRQRVRALGLDNVELIHATSRGWTSRPGDDSTSSSARRVQLGARRRPRSDPSGLQPASGTGRGDLRCC